ncbi:MAG: polymer-forming cytoskeletal protein [Gammaproteobacteria bacterium]|nr:polymer-forming cytoskeletal protein [Gammaproteobacteria bacterium]
MLDKIAKKSNDKACSTIDTLIGEQTELKGDIVFSGGLRIDGKIQGNVTAETEGSTLILSERGHITGNVQVPHLIINGTIKGNVRSNGCVELQAKAEVTGDMVYKNLEMALGATVNGNLVHEADKEAPRLKAIGGTDPVIS